MKKHSSTLFKIAVLCLILKLMNADHFSEHASHVSSPVMNIDTSFLPAKKVSKQLLTSKAQNSFIDLEDFSAFVNAYSGRPLYYEKVWEEDTTGDGSMETIKSIVSLNDDGCKIHNTITKDTDVLWDDEMVIDDVHSAYLFGSQENYQDHYPFTAFYLGVLNAAFIDELNHMHADYDYRKKFFLNKLVGSHEVEQLKAAHESELANYLDNYKGKYIFKLSMGQRDIHIWDPAVKAFVPIYLS